MKCFLKFNLTKNFIFYILSFFILSQRPVEASDLDRYIEELRSSNEDERYEAIVALGDLADPMAIPALKKLLGDSVMSVRHAVPQALAQIGGPEVEAIFKEMTASSSVEKKRLGAIGLGLLGCGEPSQKILLQLLNDESWEVRWASVFALGILGDLSVEPLLEKAKDSDQNSEVRHIATDILQRIPREVRWYGSLKEAMDVSQSQSKNLLVLFQLPSAHECKTLLDKVVGQPAWIELSRKFVCVKLNPKSVPDLAKTYSIEGVPTLLLLNPQGEILDRIEGLIPYQEYLDRMKASLEEKKEDLTLAGNGTLINQKMDEGKFDETIPLLEKRLDQGASAQILLYLGYSYGKVGRYNDAIRTLERLKSQNLSDEEREKGLYCLSLSYLALGKIGRTRKILLDLREKGHDSQITKAAAQLLEEIAHKEKR